MSINVQFKKFSVYEDNEVCGFQYDVVFLDDALVKNKNGQYLSRIYKKNGKHRYYLTTEMRKTECDICNGKCASLRMCRGQIYDTYEYQSTYIGKDLDAAVECVRSSS